MKLFDLKLAGGDQIEVTEEQVQQITDRLQQSDTGLIKIGDTLFRPSAIMLIRPSIKTHPKYSLYKAEKGRGFKGSFESFLDEIGYPRTVSDQKQLHD